jgi:hypothetical protein
MVYSFATYVLISVHRNTYVARGNRGKEILFARWKYGDKNYPGRRSELSKSGKNYTGDVFGVTIIAS